VHVHVQSIQAAWYGGDGGHTKCPDNYPADAPKSLCGHISLVELDSQMAYKQALAYWATADEQYASNAFKIIGSWSKVRALGQGCDCTRGQRGGAGTQIQG
jgi:hypothetical protein